VSVGMSMTGVQSMSNVGGMTHIAGPRHQTLISFLKSTVAAQIHLLTCLAAMFGLLNLLHHIGSQLSPVHFWACAIFGGSAIFIFAVSTICHFLSDGFHLSSKLNLYLEQLDHVAIYLFIAGSYTAFLINAVVPPWREVLMISIWVVAAAGILYTFTSQKLPVWAQHRFVYTGLFVLMGWVLMARIGEIIASLTHFGTFLLLAGGFSYTFGALAYATRRPRLFAGVFGYHEVWHLMVTVGFMCHYFLILNFYR
jgi:hemolysin III